MQCVTSENWLAFAGDVDHVMRGFGLGLQLLWWRFALSEFSYKHFVALNGLACADLLSTNYSFISCASQIVFFPVNVRFLVNIVVRNTAAGLVEIKWRDPRNKYFFRHTPTSRYYRSVLNIITTDDDVCCFFQMVSADVPDCPKFLHKGAICECVGFGKWSVCAKTSWSNHVMMSIKVSFN